MVAVQLCLLILRNITHTHTHTHRAVLQPMKQNRIKPGNSLNAQPTQPKSTQGLLVKWLPPGRRRWRWRRWRRWWRWKCTKKFVFPCRGRRNWRCWLHWSWHWSWWVHHQGNFTRNIRHRLQSVQRGVRCYRCHRCDRTMRWQVLRVLVQVIQLHWVVHTFVLAKMAVRMHLVIHGDKWYKRFYIGLQHPRSFWLWQCWPIGFRSAPLTLLFCALPFCELPSVPFNPNQTAFHRFTSAQVWPASLTCHKKFIDVFLTLCLAFQMARPWRIPSLAMNIHESLPFTGNQIEDCWYVGFRMLEGQEQISWREPCL